MDISQDIAQVQARIAEITGAPPPGLDPAASVQAGTFSAMVQAAMDPAATPADPTVANAPSGALTLEISTSLDDVYGQTLAHAFQTVVGTNS